MSISIESPMSNRKETRRNTRRNYVVDSRWQFAVTGVAVGAAGLVALLCFVFTFLLTAREPLDRLSSSQIGMIGIVVNAMNFAFLTTVIIFVIIRLTHSVAGPARVIRKAVEALREGRFDSRLTLRKHDYLKELASSVAALTDELRLRQLDEQRCLADLHQAIARRDFNAAANAARALNDMAEYELSESHAVESSVA